MSVCACSACNGALPAAHWYVVRWTLLVERLCARTGVLARLAALCTTRNDNLRAHLMRAVVRCCRNPDNRALFSSLGAAVKLIAFLRSLEVDVLKSTLLALFVLSEEPVVCSQLLDNRALPLLISLISSHDNIVQELAAAVVNNVRRSVQQDLR